MDFFLAFPSPNALSDTHLGADLAVLAAFASLFFFPFDLLDDIVIYSPPELYIRLAFLLFVFD